MLVSEAYEILKKEKDGNLTQVEFAKGMGSNPVSCNQRIKNNSELKVSEAIKLFNTFDYDFINHSLIQSRPVKFDQVEIKYIQIPGIPNEVLRSPYIKESLQFDRELVENDWQRIPENQRIIKMRGDKMETGLYPLGNNHILMVDISQTNIADSGIYLYTTQNNGELEVFINNINKRPDGSVRMSYFNSKYEDIIYTPEQVAAMEFKVYARVVKNLSLTI